MDLNLITAHAIAVELGDRLKSARLNADLTQKELAEKAGLSIKAVTNSEKGKSTLESMIAILIALEMTSQLDLFIPKQDISPIQLAKLAGKQRKRATGTKNISTKRKGASSW
ncbi:MAG: helix-turn-helix domain-containing protein [Pseudomonadales bacterium]|nr:helix-turn-helix domain-containing protein [Pseudomonadales bacterium]